MDWCRNRKKLGNKRTSGDHPNYSNVEIGQDTKENLGDMRKLAVIQTSMRNHQLMLVWKILKRCNKIANVGHAVTINHIISECCKLAQKEYKTRHEWVGKVTHWEMCKKLKFDHTNKWYMHNPASVLENDTHKLLWDFIQTDHLISARRPNLKIINNKKRDFAKLSTLLSRLTTE